jgi:hypothetical protein
MSSIDPLLARARAIPEISPLVRSRYDSLSKQLSPTAKIWFSEEATRWKARGWAVKESDLVASVSQRFPTATQAQYDALIMMFGVLAASDNRASLRFVADRLQREKDRQARLTLAAVVPRSARLTLQRANAKATLGTRDSLGPTADKLDSLVDVSMEKQMRLQMLMDAFNQTAAMISTIMKKSSDTDHDIIGNLK